jgi:hypothetical protein
MSPCRSPVYTLACVGWRVERDTPSDPGWSTWREALRVVAYRPHLRRTIRIALVVGSVLFAINQLDVVLRGDATAIVWFKIGLTYVVPFCVSNAGILIATSTRRRD